VPESLDHAVAKWIQWLEQLRRELLTMYVDRAIFDELFEGVRTSATSPGFWLNHYQRLYVSSQVMGVRRISRGDRDTVSLTNLFGEMIERREELTAAWYRELATKRSSLNGDALEKAALSYKTVWCNGGNFMAKGIVNLDRETLGRRVNVVREWADVTVAHLSHSRGPAALTWGELNSSIETISDVIVRYCELLQGTHHFMPPAMPLGWREPFTRAVFPDSL
jgi:hypothetical protein